MLTPDISVASTSPAASPLAKVPEAYAPWISLADMLQRVAYVVTEIAHFGVMDDHGCQGSFMGVLFARSSGCLAC